MDGSEWEWEWVGGSGRVEVLSSFAVRSSQFAVRSSPFAAEFAEFAEFADFAEFSLCREFRKKEFEAFVRSSVDRLIDRSIVCLFVRSFVCLSFGRLVGVWSVGRLVSKST